MWSVDILISPVEGGERDKILNPHLTPPGLQPHRWRWDKNRRKQAFPRSHLVLKDCFPSDQGGRILKQEKDILEKKIFQWATAVAHGSEFVWREFSCCSPKEPCVAIYLTLGALACHWVMTVNRLAHGVWCLSVQSPKTWELETAVKEKIEETKSFPMNTQDITRNLRHLCEILVS